MTPYRALKAVGLASVPVAAGEAVSKLLGGRVKDREDFPVRASGKFESVRPHLVKAFGRSGAKRILNYLERQNLKDTVIRLGHGKSLGPTAVDREAVKHLKDLGIRHGVYLPGKDEFALMHELGHLAVNRSAAGKVLRWARKVDMPAAAAASVIASFHPRTRRFIPLFVAAGHAPRLVDEAAATGLALRHIYRERGTEGLREVLPGAAGAFGSYLAPAAGLTAGAYILRKILGK